MQVKRDFIFDPSLVLYLNGLTVYQKDEEIARLYLEDKLSSLAIATKLGLEKRFVLR
ncbi:hypothetical protein KJ781_04980 [Patescibacteria group bacterium]|nr:hypothetical protein [Patescibacteria group bacterium]